MVIIENDYCLTLLHSQKYIHVNINGIFLEAEFHLSGGN